MVVPNVWHEGLETMPYNNKQDFKLLEEWGRDYLEKFEKDCKCL